MPSNLPGGTSLAGDGLFHGDESTFIRGSVLCGILILFKCGGLPLVVGSVFADDSSHPQPKI